MALAASHFQQAMNGLGRSSFRWVPKPASKFTCALNPASWYCDESSLVQEGIPHVYQWRQPSRGSWTELEDQDPGSPGSQGLLPTKFTFNPCLGNAVHGGGYVGTQQGAHTRHAMQVGNRKSGLGEGAMMKGHSLGLFSIANPYRLAVFKFLYSQVSSPL